MRRRVAWAGFSGCARLAAGLLALACARPVPTPAPAPPESASGGGAARPGVAPTPFLTDQCPVPPGREEYAASARLEGAAADSALLDRLASRVLGRWSPPGEDHRFPDGPVRDAKHVLSHEYALWSRWIPGAADTATLRLVFRRDGALAGGRVVAGAQDAAFRASLAGAVARATGPCEPSRCPPLHPDSLPARLGDSLVLLLRLGTAAPGMTVVQRWAAQGLGVWPLRQITPSYPAAFRQQGLKGEVVLKFDVDTAGRVDPASIEELHSTHAAFTRAAVRAIQWSRYRPAESNCRKIPWSVVQSFFFNVEG